MGVHCWGPSPGAWLPEGTLATCARCAERDPTTGAGTDPKDTFLSHRLGLIQILNGGSVEPRVLGPVMKSLVELGLVHVEQDPAAALAPPLAGARAH